MDIPLTPGRRCSLCAAPSRPLVDAALASGRESIRAIAKRFGIDKEVVRRHLHNHLGPAIQRAHASDPAAIEPTTALSLSAQILAAANRARAISEAAQERGDHGMALRGARGEVSALAVLGNRFGVVGTTMLDELAEADVVVRAVIRVARSDTHAAEVIAVALDDLDRPDLADIIRTRLNTTRSKETA